ncbi:MAG: hypothetical protein HFF90_02345 [Oscillibacter sp.]|nr:hypothetical protein [Oscillibacter sp.]
MFHPGDIVVYGAAGVCRVQEVAKPNLTGADRNKEYYILAPLHQDGVIYTPVDNQKVPMRPVISADEAEALIDLIPSIQANICRAPSVQAQAQRYQSAMRSSDCRDLVEVVKSIYAKRRQAESQRRRLGMTDERYMKQAERLLYGELSVALGIPFEDVQGYIASRVGGSAPAGSANA